jgi:hypothetical protein
VRAPAPARFRSLRALVVAICSAAIAAGCGVGIRGDFDGVPWTPDATILAVADRHDLLDRNGAIIPVRRSDALQRMHLLLTAAWLDPTEDWRRQSADSLLELKRELATSDGLLLKDIPLARFEAGDTLRANVEGGVVEGDFDVAVGAALPEASVVESQGLGSLLRITITPRGGEARPRGGSMSAEVELQREREVGQAGDIATGTVLLSFSASFLPERLAESNLTVAEPVLRCMHEKGPARAGVCRAVDELPYLDETGLVNP